MSVLHFYGVYWESAKIFVLSGEELEGNLYSEFPKLRDAGGSYAGSDCIL